MKRTVDYRRMAFFLGLAMALVWFGDTVGKIVLGVLYIKLFAEVSDNGTQTWEIPVIGCILVLKPEKKSAP